MRSQQAMRLFSFRLRQRLQTNDSFPWSPAVSET